MSLDQNGKYVPVKQNPKFTSGDLVKVRLDRCTQNNRTCYFAATETKRHHIKLEAEDAGIYLEEFAYHFYTVALPKPTADDEFADEKWNVFIENFSEENEGRFPMYKNGEILHKVLFGERGIVFVGRHFLKKVK